MFSFIVPAHNEEMLIGATVQSIGVSAEACGADYEIIVVDDSSTDETGRVAKAAGARVVRAACRQIAGARNAGARVAQGETLIFVDADTLINANAVRGMMAALDDGAIGGGARIRFDDPVPTYARILLPIVQWVNARMGIVSGCFLFCTRSAFEAVGGFNEQVYAAEEAFISRALGQRGSLVIVKQTVLTSGRKLRAYSAGEILGRLLSLGLRGTKGLRNRQNLDLWYDRRREDPKRVD